MATANELRSRLATLREQRRSIDEKIIEYETDLKRLQQPDIWLSGTRVRLKRSMATEENYEKLKGWREFLHFMTTDNIATIIAASSYKGVVSYTVRFDKQTCHYTYTEGAYETKMCFDFKADKLELYREQEGDKHEIEVQTIR